MVCAALNPSVFGSIDAQRHGYKNAMLDHVSTQLFPASGGMTMIRVASLVPSLSASSRHRHPSLATIQPPI